ncbi:xanthine dehydrogenase family protein molybdopterin-binding subunit [Micromonospora sp. KC606]|uniref:xanthine dehydrogenase family protein molybdopterin-binding subunit n=1 Tax=Micromonospora sp. KC606 TaxID=2530379 RepID=UPI001049B4EF|nr:xanthine dehydrogenase family protein molybdopterin-binding subunit [Micromonospora sp. KC606]TDC84004.1 xanthine dehydrogenase family protein molybdopterin-binding subunit [Micromonospora sp. KC606]
MSQQSPLGKPVNRVDGRLKVTGAAGYASDHHPDRLAHGYLVLSTVGRGSIRSMDTAAAQRSAGVLAVYTPLNPLKLFNQGGGLFGPNWVPLQDTEVRHHGQIVGLVVAETFEQARDAAALVRVAYDARTPVASFEDNIPNAAVPEPFFFGPAIQDYLADGVASIDDALAAAEVTVSGSYRQPIKLHNPMEPHSTVAVWRDGHVTVYSGTQAPVGHVQDIARCVGVDQARVRVVSPYVGGGFGNKAMTWGHTLLTVAAARALDRPVSTVLTREQMFTVTGHRSAVAQTVALGATRDGVLIAVKHDAYSSASTSGAMFPWGPHTTTLPLYRSENIHIGQRAVTLDIPTSTIMRAPNEEPGAFAIESAMDELAARLRMDPVELRMKNGTTVVPGNGHPWSSKHLDECYRVGARRFGWSRRNPVPGKVTSPDREWLIGMGMATAIYPAARFPSQVKIRLQADGTAGVSTAGADLGTGLWTVLAQLGADALGIPMDRIRPDIGDSALPNNTGAVSSASTAGAASALRLAAESVKRALIQLAVENPRSPFHGMNPQDVRYADGALTAAARRVSFGDLLEATGSAAVEATEGVGFGGDRQGFEFASFGAHFCEVRVNRWTGETRVSRFTTVVDAGKIINPKTARSQIIGGVIFGIGQALSEGIQVEPATGRFANANFAEYLVPVNADVPPMDVQFVQHPDTAFNSEGVRGIGELGTVGAAAAIANAVYNATGRRIRDLPITPDKLL